MPDLPVARIPSSDDAQLLMTQLGDLVPPDGSAFALVNQERKSQAGVVLGAVSPKVQVRLQYSPPTAAADFGANADAASARYLYVLLHGIGVLTNAWSANTVAWQPTDTDKPLEAEWIVNESTQLDAVTVETDPGSRGVVQVGACYGAWTLDTVQQPTHKTADNNLALHYLKSGSRAFVADTHLSYSTLLGPTRPRAGGPGSSCCSGGASAPASPRSTPSRPPRSASPRPSTPWSDAGDIDSARINLKTLHYMIYLGRP